MDTQNFSSLNFSCAWKDISNDAEAIDLLEKKILPGYLKSCRWFGGKARRLAGIYVDHVLTLASSFSPQTVFHFLILKAKYRSGKSEDYLLPVSLVANTEDVLQKGIICNSNQGWLIDAIYDEAFRKTIFIHLTRSEKIKQLTKSHAQNGALVFEKSKTGTDSGTAVGLSKEQVEHFLTNISSRVLEADQSNSSLIYSLLPVSPEEGEEPSHGDSLPFGESLRGAEYFLKIYRKLFRETNPDVEVMKFLTEQAHFSHIPAFAGTFFWSKRTPSEKKASGAPITFGMMQEKVTAIKDAWSLAGDFLNEFLSTLSVENIIVPASSTQQASIFGKRTAEMHIALASNSTDMDFAPEAFNDEYTDWLLDNCESLLKRRLRMTKDCYSLLDDPGKELSKFFIGNAAKIRESFSRIKNQSFQSLRTRIHGDYHLGQILFTGTDYVIIDFEGEPESAIKDRKIKHSPIKDVAGMLRSFHYAVSAKLYFSPETRSFSSEKIEAALNKWYEEVTQSFLDSYWETMRGNPVFRAEQSELQFLLQFHLLEKAVYELGYELNGRPAWVKIPLKGIQQVLGEIAS